MWEAVHSGPHDDIACVLGRLGGLHLRKGELREAELRLEEALQMYGKVQHGGHQYIGSFQKLLDETKQKIKENTTKANKK